MDEVRAQRVISGQRRGSSRPVIVEAEGARYFVKLRGAAQGTAPLVAEVITGRLAEALGLRTPARVLVRFEPGLPSDDKEDELAGLLTRSVGVNLGFELLQGWRDVTVADAGRVDPELAASIVWLDAFVQNPDRTADNTNLMVRAGAVALIDHGAALTFQYDWPNVTEQSPNEPGDFVKRHLFRVAPALLGQADERLMPRVTRAVLDAAAADVPDEFLSELLPPRASASACDRLRATYSAYLWKRLKAPRTFAGRKRAPFEF